MGKDRAGGSAQQKVALARDLRRQTTVSLKWITQRLEMGSWTHVSPIFFRQPDVNNKVLCQKGGLTPMRALGVSRANLLFLSVRAAENGGPTEFTYYNL